VPASRQTDREELKADQGAGRDQLMERVVEED